MTYVTRDYTSKGQTFTQASINEALATMPDGFPRSAFTDALGGSTAAGNVSSNVMSSLREDGLARYEGRLWYVSARGRSYSKDEINAVAIVAGSFGYGAGFQDASKALGISFEDQVKAILGFSDQSVIARVERFKVEQDEFLSQIATRQ